MNCFGLVACPLLFSALSLAQTAIGLTGIEGERLNQEFLAQRQESARKSPFKDVVVFTGDRVIAQFVDGGYWQTSVTVVNLENHATSFQVLFFKDDGTDLLVPVDGQGIVRGMNISLGTAGSATFQTTGKNADLAQGWALLSKSTNDSVGAVAFFRQSIPGTQPQEAVVPVVNQFDNHFVLLFDNTQPLVTGIAVANPTLSSVVIPVNIRNEAGQIVDTRTISLGQYSHTTLILPSMWPSTAGRRGVIEFLTSGFGVGALGLRFNGPAFTSLHVLSNLNWVVNP